MQSSGTIPPSGESPHQASELKESFSFGELGKHTVKPADEPRFETHVPKQSFFPGGKFNFSASEALKSFRNTILKIFAFLASHLPSFPKKAGSSTGISAELSNWEEEELSSAKKEMSDKNPIPVLALLGKIYKRKETLEYTALVFMTNDKVKNKVKTKIDLINNAENEIREHAEQRLKKAETKALNDPTSSENIQEWLIAFVQKEALNQWDKSVDVNKFWSEFIQKNIILLEQNFKAVLASKKIAVAKNIDFTQMITNMIAISSK